MRDREHVSTRRSSVEEAPRGSVPGRSSASQDLVQRPSASATDAVQSHDERPRGIGVAELFGTHLGPALGNADHGAAPVGLTDGGTVISSTDDTTTTTPVSATIAKPAGAQPAGPTGAQPAGPTGAQPAGPTGAQPAGPTGAGGASELTGEPIVNNLDTIAPTITFQGGITQGGTVGAGDFGTTNSTPTLKDIAITQATGAFTVTATFSLTTTWDTVKGTGPGGEVDIASENSPALTATNYPTAASDLTPNMSDLGGRPPRTKFWAQDLTERHEKVHAADHQRTGQEGLVQALAWLKTQTASTESEVRTLLTTMRGKIVSYIIANGAGTVGEIHAYSDGAASYKARADAIKAKGDKKEYK